MKKTLYLKFLLAYLIFAIFGFIIVNNVLSPKIYDRLVEEKSDSLYREAVLIANTYASDLYQSNTSLTEVKKQIDVLDTFMSATIWIINPSGRIVLSSKLPLNVEEVVIVDDFDPTITQDKVYTIGTFFNSFDENVLSVFAPISANYKVKGYVVIHATIDSIEGQCDSYIRLFYLLFVILFVLSLIILLFLLCSLIAYLFLLHIFLCR